MNKQQLANRIWASANKLRGKIDANEYKDYILGLIFYKFLSDKQINCLTNHFDIDPADIAEVRETPDDPDMQSLIEGCKQQIGYFIDHQYLFGTWTADDQFTVKTLADALFYFNRNMHPDFEGVFGGIFTNLESGLGKLGDNTASQNRSLRELIKLVKDVPTAGTEDYDVLGYIYEYLIGNFAANAGKKAGEFYTPHEVAMVMSEIVAEHHRHRSAIDIYDPTSGSGSLLITIGKAVSKHLTDLNQVKYYAQELKQATHNLTRMNLVMRGIVPQNIITRCADTLAEDWPIEVAGSDIGQPLAVDAVVSNPPYSLHWTPDNMDQDPRFARYGVAPKTKADYAFLLHELHHLKADGIMTIVLPHGVLFRGKAPRIFDADGQPLPPEQVEDSQGEGKIRANLIEQNNIDAVIGLPAGIFFGTGIPTIIMVLRKHRSEGDVLFIDASRGFVKDGTQNRLRACDIRRIADTWRLRREQPGYSRLVSRNEIRRNDYNLNIPRYVDSAERAAQYDIYASVYGGIPQTEIDLLQHYWQVFGSLRAELFEPLEDRPYCRLRSASVADTVAANADVRAFNDSFNDAFRHLRDMMQNRLIDHLTEVHEVATADELAQLLIERAQQLPLIDPYQLYQILTDRWPDIMGDVEIIQAEGFGACNVIEPNYRTVKQDGVEREVPDGERGRIIPFELVQRQLLGDELATLEQLRTLQADTKQQLSDLLDSLDDYEQEQWLKDNGAWDTTKLAQAQTKLIAELGIKGKKPQQLQEFMQWQFEAESSEAKLQRILHLQATAKVLKQQIAEAEANLLSHTKQTIARLDMKQIVQLLRLKWIEPIAAAIEALPAEVLSQLTDCVQTLGDKYAQTYTDIEQQLEESRTALADLIGQLTGDPYAIQALSHLVNPKA